MTTNDVTRRLETHEGVLTVDTWNPDFDEPGENAYGINYDDTHISQKELSQCLHDIIDDVEHHHFHLESNRNPDTTDYDLVITATFQLS